MSQQTKILFVIDHLRNPHAGTEGQLLQLIEGLQQSNYAPQLLVFRDSPWLAQNPPSIPTHVLGYHQLWRPTMWLALYRFAKQARKDGIQLAHIYFNDPSIICPPIFKLAGLECFISRRDMGFWYTPLRVILLKQIKRYVRLAVCNSQAVADITKLREGYPDAKVKVIYNGYRDPEVGRSIPTEAIAIFQKLELERAVIAVFVANIRPIKRMEDALRALANVIQTHPCAHLVIIGDGDQSNLLKLISDLQLTKHVHLLGPQTEIPSLLAHADIGMLCSESEGFSNAIVEYQQAGLPTVCSRVGGNPEAIEHGQTGLLYTVGDINELSHYFKQLVESQPLRKKMGIQAKQQASARYSVDKMIAGHVALYGEAHTHS